MPNIFLPTDIHWASENSVFGLRISPLLLARNFTSWNVLKVIGHESGPIESCHVGSGKPPGNPPTAIPGSMTWLMAMGLAPESPCPPCWMFENLSIAIWTPGLRILMSSSGLLEAGGFVQTKPGLLENHGNEYLHYQAGL